MRKLLRLTSFLVTAWCLSLAGLHSAVASHFQGGQLTYEAVPGIPNRYKFTLRVFRDCGGATLYTTATFRFRSNGCSTTGAAGDPADIVANLLGGSTIGSPYCATAPAGPNPCGGGLPTNYETGRYEAEVTLPPRAEWRISVNDSARPETANLVGQDFIHYEATLNNLPLVGTTNPSNNSAQFDLLNVPVPFVCWKQQSTLNFTATDADGDELVYSLEQPLSNCGDPIPYKSYATSRIIDIGTPTVPCAAVISGNGTGTYTSTFPIASFDISGPACPALRTATPSFLFNASTGSFTFTPYLYTNIVDSPLNKYVVTGKVSEYRRIAGVRTLVGSVRRDIFVVVIDCSNTVPGSPVATGNNSNSGVTIRNTTDSTFMQVSTCNYTRVLVRFTDPDPNDLLTVTFPTLVPSVPGQPLYLPEDVGTFRVVGNGTRRPVGILDLQPDVLFADQTFRIPVQIRDNGCPIIGQQTRILVISVKGRNPARVVAAANNTFVCSGATVSLTATPTRPDSVLLGIGTPVPNPRLATYTYAWEPANGLAAADQTRQNITVRPTQTTRYRVRITARDFRMIPLPTCVDTTSILVRVAPAVTANFTTTERDGMSTPGIETILPPRVFVFTNTSSVPPRVAPADTSAVNSVWTYRKVRELDGTAVTNPETPFSFRFTPRELTLRESGFYEIKLSVNNRANNTACAASVKIAEVKVPSFTTPNVFTPNRDGKNDVFVLTTEEVGGKVQIFNRWGRLVKEYASYQNDWDGANQPAGVYYYLLTNRDGKTSKGWVELAR